MMMMIMIVMTMMAIKLKIHDVNNDIVMIQGGEEVFVIRDSP